MAADSAIPSTVLSEKAPVLDTNNQNAGETAVDSAIPPTVLSEKAPAVADSAIPSIVLSEETLALDRNSEEWKSLTMKVREACETSGFFVLDYAKIPIEDQQVLFANTKDMFDLPLEKKMQYRKPTTREGGYVVSNPFVPLYESFGVYGDEEVRSFQNLMWPEGKPGFSEALSTINTKFLELNLLLLRMIFDSYGLGDYYQAKELNDNVIGNLRAMKYRLPKENEEPVGLKTHIDKTIITILCQNSVQGLQALTREGEWVTITVPKGNLVIIVGDALEVWSNDRLHAVKHRVTMTGDQERYSCGFFSIPKDGVTIEVPEKLVDEDHPVRYKPFVYSEYLLKYLANTRFDALQLYAGV